MSVQDPQWVAHLMDRVREALDDNPGCSHIGLGGHFWEDLEAANTPEWQEWKAAGRVRCADPWAAHD